MSSIEKKIKVTPIERKSKVFLYGEDDFFIAGLNEKAARERERIKNNPRPEETVFVVNKHTI